MQNIQQMMLNHKVKLAEQITGHHGPTFACKHWFEHLYFRPTWTGSPTHTDPARPPYIQSVWQNTSSIYCLDLSLNVTHLLFPHLGKSFPPSSPTPEKTYLVIAMKTKSFQQKKKKERTLNCKNNTALERDSSTGKECSLLRGWKKNMCVHAGIDICSIDLCLAEQTKDNR